MGLIFKSNEEIEQEEKEKAERERNNQKVLHDQQMKEIHETLDNSGLDISRVSDEDIDEILDVGLVDMLKSLKGLPGAWTGLALSLTGSQGTNETIKTLNVLIRQNWVMIAQNEKMLREMRRIGEAVGSSGAQFGQQSGTMVKIPAKVENGAFVAIGDELSFRGTMLVKDRFVVSRLSESQRDTISRAFKSGGSRIVVSDINDNEMILSITR